MKNASVSVVIPTFNRAHLLKRSITSVANQTIAPTEIIVVDDGSTDETPEVLRQLQSDVPTLIVVCQSRSGAPAARNAGVARATGSLLAFQDSDDVWHPEFIAALMSQHHRSGIVAFCSMRKIAPSGEVTIVPAKFEPDPRGALLRRNIISTQCALIDRQLLAAHAFDVSLPRLQDWDLWLQLIDAAEFVHVPLVLVEQHLQADSITKGRATLFKALRVILSKHHCKLRRSPVSYAFHWVSWGKFAVGSEIRRLGRTRTRAQGGTQEGKA